MAVSLPTAWWPTSATGSPWRPCSRPSMRSSVDWTCWWPTPEVPHRAHQGEFITRPPIIVVQPHEISRCGTSGVGHQHVQSTEDLIDGREHGRQGLPVADVGHHAVGRDTAITEQRRGGAHVRGCAGAHRHGEAGTGAVSYTHLRAHATDS